jgi:hypothetical protein
MENGKNGRKVAKRDYSVKTGAVILKPIPTVTSWGTLYPYWVNGYNAFEPTQGYADDCYLVAALSSVAWAAPTKIKDKTAIQIFNPEDITSYKTFNFGGANSRYTENIPLHDGNIIFARSEPVGDSWPALYEKAYAIYNSNDQENDKPNIGALPRGDGVGALKSIIGSKTTNDGDIPASNVAFNTSSNPPVVSPPTFANGKTRYPTVAWTSNRTDLPAGIYSDHTYSFFGFYKTGSKIFVILRNPYGAQFPVFNGGYGLAGIWNGINLATFGNGVFAMELEAFRNTFLAVNYVIP